MRGFSPEHRREIVDVRQALEALAVRGAAERMTLDDVDHLRLLLIRQKRAADAEREDDFIELDEEFHLRIAAGAGMPVVERLLRQLRGFVRVMHLGTTRPRGYLEHVLAEHTAIVDALEERDARPGGRGARRAPAPVRLLTPTTGSDPVVAGAAFPQRRSGPAPMRRPGARADTGIR